MIRFYVLTIIIRWWLMQVAVAGKAKRHDRRKASYEPTIVTVESHPARKVFGSLSNAEGTVWCDGNPTFWLVGHQGIDETPWCYNTTSSEQRKDNYIKYSSSAWNQPRIVTLDSNDKMNLEDGPKRLDRHSCTAVDVNNDHIDDIVCGVGANKGQGVGYTELYLGTNDRKLKKVETGFGLHKFPTMRSRFVERIRGADGSELLFIATRGAPRDDNSTNVHRMFRNVNSTTRKSALTANRIPRDHAFFFEVVKGSWQRHTRASCLVVADFNGDGLDDFLICGERSKSLLFIQNQDSSWTKLKTPYSRTMAWRNARVTDVTGDGIPDLLVVGWGASPQPRTPTSFIRVYKGYRRFPYFHFHRGPVYQKRTWFATPDLEVLDVDQNGIPDVYVVLSDELTHGTYCAHSFQNRMWWEEDNQPPAPWTPPLDYTRDLLLVGTGTKQMFKEVYMSHAEPGCGWLAQRFGNDRTMILAQGTHNRPGHNLILQW